MFGFFLFLLLLNCRKKLDVKVENGDVVIGKKHDLSLCGIGIDMAVTRGLFNKLKMKEDKTIFKIKNTK